MAQLIRNFGSFLSKSTSVLCNTSLVTSNAIAMEANTCWSLMPVRTNVRNHFPKAKENKRVKVHGWQTRMSTPEGRRTLMRRILKGRHVLSH